MSVTAFRVGDTFRFPDDPKEYEFYDIGFTPSGPVVSYWDGTSLKKRNGFYLSDLIRVR